MLSTKYLLHWALALPSVRLFTHPRIIHTAVNTKYQKWRPQEEDGLLFLIHPWLFFFEHFDTSLAECPSYIYQPFQLLKPDYVFTTGSSRSSRGTAIQAEHKMAREANLVYDICVAMFAHRGQGNGGQKLEYGREKLVKQLDLEYI